MSPLLVVGSVLIYAVAIILLWRERSLRYVLMLLAGHLALLLLPLWQLLYQVMPTPAAGLNLLNRYTIPWSVLLGGGPALALPSIIFYYGLRHRWWPRHYAIIWLYYALCVIYFLVLETFLERSGAFLFSSTLIVGNRLIRAELIQAVLLGGVSLGMSYAVISTRHYALQVALVPLLLGGIVAALLFLGIFASPLWVAGLLQQGGLIVTVGALVSLGLVLWGVHLLASGLHAGRRQRFVWR